MTLLRFVLDTDELQFQTGSSYPSSMATRVFGVQDRTAAGTVQYEELGITSQTVALVFDKMPTADHDALIDWFVNVAQGAKNSFVFFDEYGRSAEAIMIDQTIRFSEIYLGRYSGTVNLELLTDLT